MIINSLTATKKNRVIDNITLNETINVSILDKLITSDLLLTNEWDDFEYSNEREQLKAYREIITNGNAKVKYTRVKDIEFGRVSPIKSLGLHTIRRAIRHTLAKDNYIDIDIVNCHPVLLYQVCKKHNLECDILEEYVLNRDDKLKMIIDYYNVDKAVAKNLFIILLYFGGFDGWLDNNKISNTNKEIPKFITKFIKEIKEIGKIISDNNEELNKLIEKRKKKQNKDKYNKIGSCVSYFLQEIECEILEILYKYCIRNNIITNNAVLCADGLMIPKDKYNDSLLTEFSKEVKDKTGFELTFIKKEMNEDYLNILDEHQLSEKEINKLTLNDYEIKSFDKSEPFTNHKLTKLFKEDINNLDVDKYIKYFHLTNSFNYFNLYHAEFYLSNKIYLISNENKLESYSDFEKSFDHLYIILDKKHIKFTTLYKTSEYKKVYSSFDFEPNKKIIDDKFNLFKGFYYENGTNDYDLEVANLFVNHIKFLCNEDEKVYNYVINWFAHIIQKPEIKTNVAVVFYSYTEGIGKNITFDIFGKILKGYCGKFKDTDAITDKFNGDLFGKLFIVGDEINAKAQGVANEVKDIITRKTETIEFKGKDKMHDVMDYKNYGFTTNNEYVFKISNSDRRFLLNECPEEKKSEEYYGKLYDILDDDNKLRSIYNYLKTLNIRFFNVRDIPKTEYKKNLIFHNLPAYLKFIKEDVNNFEGQEFKSSDLFKLSIEYAKRNKQISSYSEKFFYTNFKKVFGEYNMIKNKISYYSFPDDLSLIVDDKIRLGYVEN